MKKLMKVFGFFAVGAIVLLAGLTLALKVFFPPEKVKALVAKQIEMQVHRAVQMGEVSVGLFSGLSVSDFKLSEAPDFSKGTFISSEKFVVRPRLLPLLAKKLFVKEVELIKPEVTVVRFADGKTYNFSSLTSSSPAAAVHQPEAADKPSLLALVVSKASIESGKLKFIDQSPAAQSIEINPLDLTIRNFTLAGPVDLQTSCKFKIKGVEIEFGFAGMVNLIKGAAKIKTCAIASGNSKINVSGEAHDFFAKEPAFDLIVDLQKLEPAFIQAFASLPPTIKLPGALSGNITAKGTLSALDLAASLNLGKLTLSCKGGLKNASGPAPEMKIKIQTNDFLIPEILAVVSTVTIPKGIQLTAPARFSCDLSGTPEALNIQNIQFILNPIELTGGGRYKSTGKNSSYAFDLNSNSFSLEEVSKMVASLQEYQLDGKTSVTAKIISEPLGPNVTGTAHLQGVSASFQKARLTNIVSTIDFTMKDAAGKLTADELKHDYFSGKKMTVTWNLTDAADMAKINGTAQMHLGPGEFQNIQKLTSDSKAAKILFLPLTVLQKFSKATGGAVKIPSLDKVNYKEIKGDYVFKSGVMNITSFNLLGDISADMKGTVGLSGTQALDLKAQMKLKAGLIGGTLGETFQNDQGQTTLNMVVKGTVEDPKVNIDMKDTGKKILDVVKERLGDHPEEKVKDLLKGLFNR